METKTLQRTGLLSSHQNLKLQVPHRVWFSLVVHSVYKSKKKYPNAMLRLAVSAFMIQGLALPDCARRGSSLTSQL